VRGGRGEDVGGRDGGRRGGVWVWVGRGGGYGATVQVFISNRNNNHAQPS
jgi:hypothetical protein